MNTKFYAVARHGTDGLGNSYGHAYVVQENDVPRHDQKTTVWGPYTQEIAENAVAKMNALCYRFVLERDLAQYNYELAEINVVIEYLNYRIDHLRNNCPDADPSDLFRRLHFEKSVIDYINRRIEKIQEKIRVI